MSKAQIELYILEHLCKKLESQSAHVEQMRNRAAISAAITGLVGTFFGSLIAPSLPMISGGSLLGFSIPAMLGFILFGASLAFAVLVVVDVSDFTFSFETQKMTTALRQARSAQRFVGNCVRDGEWYFSDNEDKIKKVRMHLWWSMAAGFAQIIPWLLVLNGVIKNGE